MPHQWEMVAPYYRQLLAKVSAEHLSYMVYDDLMGWTVGPNRRSANGLYVSSAEGLRAPSEGVTIVKHTGKVQIALVGDSFTFGDEVRYEDTWGAVLEQGLGSQVQVLNFGVRSYGLDQIYLRYEKDVRPWHPDIVILGLISHDVKRSMVVYPWLAFPEWDMPFSKSRFILRDGVLTNVNVPPLVPDAIFSTGSMTELPLLEYQNGYRPIDWQSHFYHHSYLVRLCVTWFPRWLAMMSDVSEEVSVNAAIVKAFTRSVLHARSIPLVVYFPTKREVEHPSAELPIGKRVLQEADVAYTDLTPCMITAASTELFAPNRHYSPQGNAAVATCLRTIVNETLAHVRR